MCVIQQLPVIKSIIANSIRNLQRTNQLHRVKRTTQVQKYKYIQYLYIQYLVL